MRRFQRCGFAVVCSAALLFAGAPRIHGFFVQPELGYGATDYQSFGSQQVWNDWLGSMKAVGAEMLFYQWSVKYQTSQAVSWYVSAYPGTPSPGDYAHYDIASSTINGIATQSWSKPTSWPGTPNQGGKESVQYLLDAAAANGMKVWLGLYLCESDFCNWWQVDNDKVISAAEQKAIDHHVDRSIQVAEDLLDQFGTHDGLGGLYYSIEPANISFMHTETRPALASAIDRVAQAIHTKQPGMQLAICPFFNINLPAEEPTWTNRQKAEAYAEMWDYVLAHSELDILMLQDGVGVDPATLTSTVDSVSVWYEEMRKVADKNGVPFWGNAELFTNLGTRESVHLVPSEIEKIKLQIETMAPHVDKIVSFSFSYLDENHDIYNFSSGILGGGYDANKAARKALYDGYRAYYNEYVATVDPVQALTPFRFISLSHGAVVEWNGAPERWNLSDVQGRVVSSGVLTRGENHLGWGPLVPGRYYWRSGSAYRSILLAE